MHMTSAASVVQPASTPRFTALPPFALYIHIPWCVRKCPYCDFNSHELHGALPEREYIAALVSDLEHALPQVWNRRVTSVFFGGGTPSVLSAQAIDVILSNARARLPIAADAEITLEANPGTFEAARFRAYHATGVNRLSIGIQSFNRGHLQALGRIHDDAEARRAVEIARGTFDNVNLDLMYALPQQTVEEARADIDTAVQYAPSHLSAYHLTIEPNTYFHRYPPRLPTEDISAAMQEEIEARLAVHGYTQYEVSAFAKSRDLACRHNLNYWTFGDYLGIGAGAHSKISSATGIMREMRYKQPRQYMESAARGTPVQSRQELTGAEAAFEFMMNALRLTSGFEARLFGERAGVPLTAVMPALDEAERRGLLERDHRRIAPTALGRRFLNDLLQIFLPAR
jgi:oxygen-independent coproporphyrinogen-3 oxidase